MNSIVYLSKCSYVKIFITLLLLSFVGKKIWHIYFLFLCHMIPKLLKSSFISIIEMIFLDHSKDLLYWENFEYQIDVLLSIINIAVVNTKFALRWNYIMKVISNRFRSVVSLTASCCVRQCWYIFSHIVKHMTTIHNNTMMRCMLTGYLNDINWISALYIYIYYICTSVYCLCQSKTNWYWFNWTTTVRH